MINYYDPSDETWQASDPDEEKRKQQAQQANYDTKAPFQLATGELFNYGAPGSRTEAINRNNPTASLDKPYVQQGDTGGFLVGKGITVGEGSSMTPQEQADYNAQIQAAVASGQLTQAEVDAWKKQNPNDEGRGLGALLGHGGDNKTGGSSVSQAWNSNGSALQGRADDFYQQLLARSQQTLNIDRNDPLVRNQADAFAANTERQRRDYLNDLAESRGPLANLLGEERLSRERAGSALGSFEAEIMNRERMARRDEIAQALNIMGGRITAEQNMALQRELAELDAALRREGFGWQDDWLQKQLAVQLFGMGA